MVAEVRQHDGQVVDVNLARRVAIHVALTPGVSGRSKVCQDDGQVVDVNPAITIDVARFVDYRGPRLQEEPVRRVLGVDPVPDDPARSVDRGRILQSPA